ncbi:hypothetical protein DFH06DRAFT_1092702 [Mycena polygramma]|nr:hypothetical protein DFH06DRAFT_1092702 [Mycena polygramma]
MADAESPSKSKATTAKPSKAKDAGKAKDAKPASKAAKKETAPVAPVSPGKAPKKVEVHLPGPSPRTAKAEASASAKKGKSHVRSASSISSIKRIADDATDSPSSKKPLSAARSKRFATPPEDADDNVSVAESSMSMGVGAIRRTEAERIEYFNNQSDCSNIEPHNVTCTRCNKTVQLGRKQTYTVKPWETHRKRCDRLTSGSVIDDGGSVMSEVRSEVGSMMTDGQRKAQLNQEQRKVLLESDHRAETVLPDKVLCRKCKKWVRLSSRTEYQLVNWNTHQATCADAVVSSRVAMAQRKINLVNDPQAKAFSPRHVECRLCDANIALAGEGDYTLTQWELHKQTCSPRSLMVWRRPVKSTRPPRSSASASTEATLVAGASSSRGKKRALEDPELAVDDPDARKANRPRTESYEPVQKDPPSILGWFLMPFKAFIHGFKESLAETPTPP